MKRHNHKRITLFSGGAVAPWGGDGFFSNILIILSVILMAVSAFKPNIFDDARIRVTDFFAPALNLASWPFYNISKFFSNISDLAQLQAENLRLEQENKKLREWYQVAMLLDSENKSLRKLLNLQLDPEYTHISARIIADAGNAYAKSFVVNVGAKDGVEKGAAVLSGDGLVGRIIEVGNNSSRILLASDINLRVPVVVEDTGQHAIMTGTNDRYPKLIYLPKDSEISEGARLVTSGYGGAYPHGLPVGRVFIDDYGQTRVALFSDFDKMQIVRILQKGKD